MRTRIGQVCLLAIVTAIPAVTLHTTGPASAAPAGGHSRKADDAAVMAAIQRDLGLTPQQTAKLMRQQAEAIAADRALRASLGADFGGSWFDAESGRLIVSITKPDRAAEVAAKGAQARVAKHGQGHLSKIVTELDTLAGRSTDRSRNARNGKRSNELAGLVSWYADAKTDQVVVTAMRGTAAPAAVAKHGDAVRVEYTDNAPQATTNYMDGGDQINGSSCSAGFNLRNPWTGQGYLLTAGHCVLAGSSVSGQGGFIFGTTRQSYYPTYDDAIVSNDYAGYWIQGPWVDLNPSNGSYINITGWTDAPVGTYVCKSGIKTFLTCGYITAKLVTVTYWPGGHVVYGVTQHSACAEPGDSGGANFAVTSVYSAEGVSSGAVLHGPTQRCGQAVGQPNVSWYFPMANSMPHYGPAFGVVVW